LDQSTASFLDQSTASFLDAQNPAYGHATLVAGIIAAIAPDSMIMPLRVFDDQGSADVFSMAKAIYYAADHGAQVINMSFGTQQNSHLLHTAIQFALSKNIVLVTSAGNDDTSTQPVPVGIPRRSQHCCDGSSGSKSSVLKLRQRCVCRCARSEHPFGLSGRLLRHRLRYVFQRTGRGGNSSSRSILARCRQC
jgi:subtilisin family serine protease